MDSVRRFLADSLDHHTDIGGDKLCQQIILNGAYLLTFSQTEPLLHPASASGAGGAGGDPSSPGIGEALFGGRRGLGGGKDLGGSVDHVVDLTIGAFLSEEMLVLE